MEDKRCWDLAGQIPDEELQKTDIPSIFVSNDSEKIKLFDQEFDEFGKESLGIINLSHPDFGTETLTFLYNQSNNDNFGRESLGILNLNHLDLGRDSIGLSNLNLIPSLNIEENSNDNITNDSILALNTAFLMPSRTSLSSIGSSNNSMFPSFNSASLERSIPSRIFSSTSTHSPSFMNQAFVNSINFIDYLNGNISVFDEHTNPHLRTRSLPCELEPKQDNLVVEEALVENVTWNGPKSNVSLKKPSNSVVEEEDVNFNNSVFIEAKHLASRFADGSFLTLDDQENDMLDAIKQPEDLNDAVFSDETNLYCDGAIVKLVDKLLPHVNSLENELPDSNSIPINSDLPKNCSNCLSSFKNTSSKSKKSQEMLNTLSEILNNSNPTDELKSEGQHLLTSLAEILLSSGSSKSNHLDDSGHSSIENEPVATTPQPHEYYEVLDLRKKNLSASDRTESYENCAPLDLSLKSRSNNSEKTFLSPKLLPQKYKNSLQKDNISLGSNCSGSSVENKSLEVKSKFRPKKTDSAVGNKKGPLKAFPLDNMARRKSGGCVKKNPTTPTRSESHIAKFKHKKTSTPINEQNLKPVAQSTPDFYSTFTSPVSKYSRDMSQNMPKQKLNYSGPNLLGKSLDAVPKTFTRQRSVGDLKKSGEDRRTLIRSYSVGEKSSAASTASSVRKSLSQTSQSLKRNSVGNGKILQEINNKSFNASRFSLYGKKTGKENVF